VLKAALWRTWTATSAAASEYHRDALKRAVQSSSEAAYAYALFGIALTETALGHPERAATLHGAVGALMTARGERLESMEARLRAGEHARLRRLLGNEAFGAHFRRGADQPLGQIIAVALRTGVGERADILPADQGHGDAAFVGGHDFG